MQSFPVRETRVSNVIIFHTHLPFVFLLESASLRDQLARQVENYTLVAFKKPTLPDAILNLSRALATGNYIDILETLRKVRRSITSDLAELISENSQLMQYLTVDPQSLGDSLEPARLLMNKLKTLLELIAKKITVYQNLNFSEFPQRNSMGRAVLNDIFSKNLNKFDPSSILNADLMHYLLYDKPYQYSGSLYTYLLYEFRRYELEDSSIAFLAHWCVEGLKSGTHRSSPFCSALTSLLGPDVNYDTSKKSLPCQMLFSNFIKNLQKAQSNVSMYDFYGKEIILVATLGHFSAYSNISQDVLFANLYRLLNFNLTGFLQEKHVTLSDELISSITAFIALYNQLAVKLGFSEIACDGILYSTPIQLYSNETHNAIERMNSLLCNELPTDGEYTYLTRAIAGTNVSQENPRKVCKTNLATSYLKRSSEEESNVKLWELLAEQPLMRALHPTKFNENYHCQGDIRFPSSNDSPFLNVWSAHRISPLFIAAAGVPVEPMPGIELKQMINSFKNFVKKSWAKHIIGLGKPGKDFSQIEMTATFHNIEVVDNTPIHILNHADLIHLLNIVAEAKQSRTPIIIHCTSGVGRTGNLIAVLSLLERTLNDTALRTIVYKLTQQKPLKEEEENYLLGQLINIIKSMRLIRYSIQTKEQLTQIIPQMICLFAVAIGFTKPQLYQLQQALLGNKATFSTEEGKVFSESRFNPVVTTVEACKYFIPRQSFVQAAIVDSSNSQAPPALANCSARLLPPPRSKRVSQKPLPPIPHAGNRTSSPPKKPLPQPSADAARLSPSPLRTGQPLRTEPLRTGQGDSK